MAQQIIQKNIEKGVPGSCWLLHQLLFYVLLFAQLTFTFPAHSSGVPCRKAGHREPQIDENSH